MYSYLYLDINAIYYVYLLTKDSFEMTFMFHLVNLLSLFGLVCGSKCFLNIKMCHALVKGVLMPNFDATYQARHHLIMDA